jgi:hypothetical protein
LLVLEADLMTRLAPLIVSALAAILTGGCAADYHEPALPREHPANAEADVAPPLASSRTLSISGDRSPGESKQPDQAAPSEGPSPQPAGHQHHGQEGAPKP